MRSAGSRWPGGVIQFPPVVVPGNEEMSVSNRFELAPYLLVAVDFVVACCAAVAVLPLGVTQIAVPILLLLVIYASGEYSLLSEITLRGRFGVALGCLLFLLIARGCAPFAPCVLAASLAGMGQARDRGVGMWRLCRSALRPGGISPRTQPALRPASGTRVGGSRRGAAAARDPFALSCRDPAGFRAGPCGVQHARGGAFPPPRRGKRTGAAQRQLRSRPPLRCRPARSPPAVLARRPDYVDWHRHERRLYDIVKRGFDAAAAAVLFAISLPLMAFAAVGIALSDGRPVLFRQARVGRFGRRFMLLKFRTLRAETAAAANPNDAIEQRVFRFGALLRDPARRAAPVHQYRTG